MTDEQPAREREHDAGCSALNQTRYRRCNCSLGDQPQERGGGGVDLVALLREVRSGHWTVANEAIGAILGEVESLRQQLAEAQVERNSLSRVYETLRRDRELCLELHAPLKVLMEERAERDHLRAQVESLTIQLRDDSVRHAHHTEPVVISDAEVVHVDAGIAPLVKLLNSISGVRTVASCEGHSNSDDERRAHVWLEVHGQTIEVWLWPGALQMVTERLASAMAKCEAVRGVVERKDRVIAALKDMLSQTDPCIHVQMQEARAAIARGESMSLEELEQRLDVLDADA